MRQSHQTGQRGGRHGSRPPALKARGPPDDEKGRIYSKAPCVGNIWKFSKAPYAANLVQGESARGARKAENRHTRPSPQIDAERCRGAATPLKDAGASEQGGAPPASPPRGSTASLGSVGRHRGLDPTCTTIGPIPLFKWPHFGVSSPEAVQSKSLSPLVMKFGVVPWCSLYPTLLPRWREPFEVKRCRL